MLTTTSKIGQDDVKSVGKLRFKCWTRLPIVAMPTMTCVTCSDVHRHECKSALAYPLGSRRPMPLDDSSCRRQPQRFSIFIVLHNQDQSWDRQQQENCGGTKSPWRVSAASFFSHLSEMILRLNALRRISRRHLMHQSFTAEGSYRYLPSRDEGTCARIAYLYRP